MEGFCEVGILEEARLKLLDKSEPSKESKLWDSRKEEQGHQLQELQLKKGKVLVHLL